MGLECLSPAAYKYIRRVFNKFNYFIQLVFYCPYIHTYTQQCWCTQASKLMFVYTDNVRHRPRYLTAKNSFVSFDVFCPFCPCFVCVYNIQPTALLFKFSLPLKRQCILYKPVARKKILKSNIANLLQSCIFFFHQLISFIPSFIAVCIFK